MADFLPAFERTLINEGGYKLTNIKDDRGGQTYAGIARNAWPKWQGWSYIDNDETPPADMVRLFYRRNFWDPLGLTTIIDQRVAHNIYDFGVNAGTGTAAKLAQIVVGATPDGKIGQVTTARINTMNPDLFLAQYALAKLARYEQIVSRDRTQGKFLLGWVRRVLKEAA